MGVENILHEIQAPDLSECFSPDFYFLSVFGRPDADNCWAVRIDGHHLALHLTVLNGQITSTPLFLGTEPAPVQHGHLAGLPLLQAAPMQEFPLRNPPTESQAKQA